MRYKFTFENGTIETKSLRGDKQIKEKKIVCVKCLKPINQTPFYIVKSRFLHTKCQNSFVDNLNISPSEKKEILSFHKKIIKCKKIKD